MCLAFPGTVTKITGREAEVEYPDGRRKALLGEEKIVVGDNVLVQMGVIVKKISNKEQRLISAVWKELSK